MSLTVRRIFFLSFVFLFFVIAGTVLLYGSGFIIDWHTKTIKKTGILLVRGEPENAQVLLNNEPVATGLPYRKIHLPPATYSITLSKEGHYPWNRDLIIEGGITSFVGDVVLWKKTLPNRRVSLNKQSELLHVFGEDSFLVLSPSSTQEYELSLVTNSGNERLLSAMAPRPTVMLSPEKTKAIVYTTNTTAITRASVITLSGTEETFDLVDATASTSTITLAWHNENDWLIYGQEHTGALWQFNTLNKTKKHIGNGTLIAVYDDGVYFTPSQHTEPSIFRWDATTENTRILPLGTIPSSVRVNGSSDRYAVISSQDQSASYIINLEDEKSVPSPVAHPTIVRFSPKINTLLLANNHELWMRDVHQNNTLLWRTSEVIKDILFIADTHYTIVTTNQKTRILALDTRDGQKNTIELPLPEITSLKINDDGTLLFAGSASSTAYGIFSLELRYAK